LNELRDLKETTNNVEKPFSTMAKEVNKIREQEYNRARKDILEEELNSIEREEKPMTIEDICVDRDKEFIEHKHRGHKLSTDRENYPEVFQEMKDLYNKLVEEIGITRITKST
jgi:septal ring factor EnvC (AmiA/AmiB activator)